jgi:hypothetical protein
MRADVDAPVPFPLLPKPLKLGLLFLLGSFPACLAEARAPMTHFFFFLRIFCLFILATQTHRQPVRSSLRRRHANKRRPRETSPPCLVLARVSKAFDSTLLCALLCFRKDALCARMQGQESRTFYFLASAC